MTVENAIIQHYERENLTERILEQARTAAGSENLTAADLAPFDNLHIGSELATEHFIPQLGLEPGMKILDIGSGPGGPARFAAEKFSVHVTGIDLTPGYRKVAAALSAAVNLADKTEFITGNALAMPFDDGSFDAALTLHAAMNIPDRETLYREAGRILKPGSVFGIYDVMADSENPVLIFPVPWAETQETSFLLTPGETQTLLENAGFEIFKCESRRDFSLNRLHKLLNHETTKARTDSYPLKIGNLTKNIENGLCAPWQMICRRVIGSG